MIDDRAAMLANNSINHIRWTRFEQYSIYVVKDFTSFKSIGEEKTWWPKFLSACRCLAMCDCRSTCSIFEQVHSEQAKRPPHLFSICYSVLLMSRNKRKCRTKIC